MIRNLRKIASLAVAVATFLSVCAVAFGTFTGTAYTVNGTAVSEARTFTYNFKNDATDASDYTSADNGASTVVNKLCSNLGAPTGGTQVGADSSLLRMGHRVGNGSGALHTYVNEYGMNTAKVFIKDSDCNLGNTNGWLRIEADTIYEITVKFKARSASVTGSETFGLGIGLSNQPTGETTDLYTAKNFYAFCLTDEGAYKEGIQAGNTAVHTISATIHGNGVSPSKVTANASITDPANVIENTGNVGKVVALMPVVTDGSGDSAEGHVLVTEVTVTVRPDPREETFVYDFVSSSGSSYSQIVSNTTRANNWLPLATSTGTNKTYIDTTEGATGMHLGIDATKAGCKNLLWETDGWQHIGAFVRDSDHNGGDYAYNTFLTIEAGKTYSITAKFKGGNGLTTSDTYGLALGLNTGAGAYTTSESAYGDAMSFSQDIKYTAENEWNYVTLIVDGDGTSRTTYDSANSAWNTAANAGRQVVLMSSGTANGTVFIESVTVKVLANDIDKSFKVVPKADGSYDVTVAKTGTVLVDEALTNTYGEKVLGYMAVNGTSTEYVTKLDRDTVFLEDPAGAPAYPTAEMDRELDIWNPNGNTHWSIVDSGDAHGKVLCFTPDLLTQGTAGYDISIRQQKVEVGKRYYVSMDVRVTDKNTVINNLRTYTASEAGIGVMLNKEALSNQGTAGTHNTTKFSTEWTRVGFVFTPDDRLTYEYLILGIGHGITSGDSVSKVYIDNVNVTEFTPDDDDVDAENSVVTINSIRKEISGDTYQSAGLRFNGTLDNTAIQNAKDIGFIIIPTKLADAFNGNWFEAENWDAAGAKPASCKSTVYSSTATTTSYQLILTGLSTEDGKTAYNTNFTAKMYVRSADDTYTYYDLNTASYAEVKAAYRVYGSVSDAEWVTY